ncbi:hypothetical protein C4588_07205 [Candidatus Parcubacteria bacterium]|nr:MAG: hypothetical protein C4588_07205 [Candidatus Parcubacteria bacterium]
MANVRYAGRRYTKSSSGDRLLEVWRIEDIDATDVFKAPFAPGVPRVGDELVVDGVPQGIYVQEVTIDSPSDGVERPFSGEVVYGPPTGSIPFDPAIDYITWSAGTEFRRNLVSENGRPIGVPFSAEEDGTYNLEDGGLEDSYVDLGVDLLYPVVDISIRKKRVWSVDPFTLISKLRHTNEEPIIWQGFNTSGQFIRWVIPAGFMIFLGYNWVPVGVSSFDLEVTLYFSIGSFKLPLNLPTFVEDTNTPSSFLPGSHLPLRYVPWPRYNLKRIPDPDTGDTLINRSVVGLSIAEAYPPVSFADLLQ